jgi:transposase
MSLETCLFCMEHTGIYNNAILKIMEEQKLSICLESSLQIKQSLGLQRGKNDQIDSYRIAMYAYKNRDFITLWQPERSVLKQLRRLNTLRQRLVNAKHQLQVSFREEQKFICKHTAKQIQLCCKRSISALQQDILKTQKAIQAIIESDELLTRLFQIIESIPGVGKITATEIVLNTGEFKRIPTARKYACYAGVAPFEHSSGTSVRGRTRVSKKANMKAKSLLHMSALTAARYCKDLKQYYDRKVQEGKSKMNVLNAIKNKIIHRIFSCVQHDRLYQVDFN